MTTQKWLIFEADATQSYINWHLARNPDVCGYFTGCPLALMEQATEEGWTYRPPHVWIEEVPDAGA
jgi:hypothetical protein